MRKILSAILTVSMIFSMMPASFALESESVGAYNSLKLPVINEIRDNSAVSLMSTGSAVAASSDNVLEVTNLGAQTAPKGETLKISGFSSIASEEVMAFYENYWEDATLIVFEKNGAKKMFFAYETMYSQYSDVDELHIPIPSDLENGTYNVTAHQLNNIWDYREGGYSELVFTFPLTVTDGGNSTVANYALNEIVALGGNASYTMLEGEIDYNSRPTATLANSLPGETKMVGFALGADGCAYSLSAYCDGSVIELNDELEMLPGGTYGCYFYDRDNRYGNELYGPYTVNIGSLKFRNDYFSVQSGEQWTELEMGASAAEKLPLDLYGAGCTLSMTVKNASGAVVHNLSGIAVEDLWVNGWEDEIYGGTIYFNFNLMGFTVGTYTADVTLHTPNNISYQLGNVVLNVTDKTIIDNAYILNYSGELTTSTESFYVCLKMSNMFLDYDKLTVNLLDENGNVIAETVSKELYYINSYNGSTLLYKMNVTESLSENNRYTLEILSDSDLELLSAVDSVTIRVTADARVIRAEFSDTNTVKVYTENVVPGEYLLLDTNTATVYNITIDGQGIGTFQMVNADSNTYYYFNLQDLDGNYIDHFDVRMNYEQDNFSASPNFLAIGMTQLDNFFVRALSEQEKPSVDQIEYARFTQNGEVIATMSNLRADNWSYYQEAGTRMQLYGTVSWVPGKTPAVGTAVFEIKYTDGFIYTHTIPVASATSKGLFGSLSVANSCYYNVNLGNYYANNAIGSNKASFTINNTNATSGTVSLYEQGSDIALETLNLANLQKTVRAGAYYTYQGSFNTTISNTKAYDIRFSANESSKSFSGFTYYPGKMMELNNDLTAVNGICDIYCHEWLNISNLNNVTFKAVVGNQEYALPVANNYSGSDYLSLEVNTSGVPVGHFSLKAYDNGAPITLSGTTNGYNFGVTQEPRVTGAGWHWVGENREGREFCLYGANLDKVNSASVKVFRTVEFNESEDYYNRQKLEYVKDITLSKPYGATYIAINNELLSDLSTGAYLLVYVLDGKAVETQDIYKKGNTPTYRASMTVNDGISFTNKTNVTVAVTATGYTKMKLAFSEAELANAGYENIVSQKNVSLEGKDGLVTIYVQFANDDETETEILSAGITVDATAPSLNHVMIPEIVLWQNATASFETNELLRNAFVIIGTPNSATGVIEGRTYVFAYKGEAEGVYTYECNLYGDSWYQDASGLKAQIIALDKAGNQTTGNALDVSLALPRDISGTITYGTNAVANLGLYLYDENGSCVSYAYTDANGVYTFHNITKGNYVIKLRDSMYTATDIPVSETEFTADITGKDFALETIYNQNSVITVTVKDYSGAPLANAYASAYSWATGVNLSATTDSNGVATITVPYQNGGTSYRIYANHSDYATTEYITVDAATEAVTINFPQKAVITGIAKRGESLVANTEVIITGNGYNTYATTDANGEFSVDVYLSNANKTFVVSVRENTKYTGSATVIFEGDSLAESVELQLKANIRIKGSIKDDMEQPIASYSSIYFRGNGIYLTVTPDANGEFETPDVFGAGTYTVSAYDNWPYQYKSIETTVEITEEDLASPMKELNLVGEKIKTEKLFTSMENGVTASAAVIAKGDIVTINVKVENDGTATLSDLSMYAKIPAGLTVDANTNGTISDGMVEKTVATLKADEKANLTFTVDTDNYNEKSLVIPAYVKVGGKEYPLDAVVVEIVSVTLSAPQVVKENTAFKVSGEAIPGSTVEILDYNTKAVLATTDLISKWYFADIAGLSEDTTLIARVSKDNNMAYSEPVEVKVEANPITLKDVKIKWGYSLNEYGINENYGYPTLSIWEGYDFIVLASFENMPANATVTYSFSNRKDVAATKDGEYFKAGIKNWSGYGTKKVIATVTDGENTYEFIVAELIILIDPSGYITDAETGEPIVGATVLLEVKDGDNWITWDAVPHLQQNPMLTDDEGHYGWMVPEGEYRIIVTADGYATKVVETYDSRDYGDNSKITVLPVRTDVDIVLTNTRAVELDTNETVSVAGGKVKFVFTRPVKPETVTADNFKVLDASGNEVSGTLILAENNTVVLFKPQTAMANGNYTLSVANIEDNANNVIPTEEISFTKSADAAALAVPAVNYSTTDGALTLTFAAGKVPANTDAITVKSGNTEVPGTIRVNENVVTFIPDVAFTANAAYQVVLSEALRTDANEYLATEFTQAFSTSGPKKSSAAPTGTVSISVATPVASVAAGAVEKGTEVKLSTATNGATIYYTIDGSNPTTASSVYAKAIVIDEATTVKAIAVKGKYESSMLIASYTIKGEETEKPVTTVSFGDITNYEWAQEAISALAEKGIIKGVSETEFAPANDIKRADYMLLLVRMLGLEAEVSENFSDVSADKYYYEGVGVAKALGLTTGVGDNQFNPEASITRQDMFVLAYRILEMQKAELSEASADAINGFDDYAQIADYAKDGLATLVQNELVKGSDNLINPVGNATRAETAVFIYRLYNLLNE